MTVELVPLATVEVIGGTPISIGDGPAGNRQILEVVSMRTQGRLVASLKGAACADWATISADGIVTLDVRATLETDDGALIYVAYQGRADLSRGMADAVIYAAPRFETSDSRYKWLNSIQAVGKGVFIDGILRYEWYEVR